MPCLMPQACLWLLYWALFLFKGKLKSWKYGIFSPSWSLVLQELVKVESDEWYNVKEIEGSVHFLVFSTRITYSSPDLWLRSCPLGWWQAIFLNVFMVFYGWSCAIMALGKLSMVYTAHKFSISLSPFLTSIHFPKANLFSFSVSH